MSTNNQANPSPRDVLEQLQFIDLEYEQADLIYQFAVIQAECERKRTYAAIKKKEGALYKHQIRVLEQLEKEELREWRKREKERGRSKDGEHRQGHASSLAEKIVLICDPFSGSLSDKTKDDLLVIASSLGLSQLDESSFKTDILSTLRQHFNSHPELKAAPRYAGLFGGKSLKREASPPAEECTPATQRRRLDD
ncbi:hypothetical protein VKT23_000348 [Stygiomarasmius scandens]|uniref:Uncharacterized protein n=1 Tax=Marasmiellus scandens TaxID=2682957 RepID=A0ABR1K4V4_9AGAR